jgi:anti-sigma regulatory factor (Ser/Thr protein kinase)
LRQQLLDDVCRLDAGQFGIESLKLERQPLLVEAQQMKQRGVKIAHMHPVADDIEVQRRERSGAKLPGFNPLGSAKTIR